MLKIVQPFVARIAEACKQLKGVYSLVFITEDKLVVMRDPYGFRPLVMGRKSNGAVVFAFETCALDLIQAILARESPVDCDVGIAVLDSRMVVALGHVAESGVPFMQGLIWSYYVGRMFIQPTQTIKDLGVKLKLVSLKAVIEGKQVVVIDDSIERGTTSLKIVRLLKEGRTAEIHENQISHSHSTRFSRASSSTPQDWFEAVGIEEDQADEPFFTLNRICLMDVTGEKAQLLKEHYEEFKEKLEELDEMDKELD
ncbi:hypothetical protein GIB67_012169 [Kingdonia uniflora]|uniref:Glutamine amidotransferase type-2 domain-containing protein n=1 Tax=Kingdonia uniflora TaxID=39325 RepID=A0A7J7NNJ3_9MAGN|nr:hypothetical protein GIB67_012169 [Kingdonia uniflora]